MSLLQSAECRDNKILKRSHVLGFCRQLLIVMVSFFVFFASRVKIIMLKNNAQYPMFKYILSMFSSTKLKAARPPKYSENNIDNKLKYV